MINTPQFAQLKVFNSEPPKEDYYLIGCDTAQSLNSAFNAIEVFGFRDFEQIAELKARFGSYTVFADAIHYVFQWLREKVGDKILLCVENNTIGQAPIEILRFQYQFDYDFYLYREKQENLSKKPEQYGIKTTGLTKPHMAGCLIEHVNENIQGIKSSELIDQFGSIERTQTGGIRSNSYSDLFMSACFCAYVRSKKAVEIMPLLDKKPSEYNKEVYDNAMDLVKSSDLKNKVREDEKRMQGVFESEEEIISGTGSDDPLDDVGFLPFFSS